MPFDPASERIGLRDIVNGSASVLSVTLFVSIVPTFADRLFRNGKV